MLSRFAKAPPEPKSAPLCAVRIGEGGRYNLVRVLTVGDTDVIFGATDHLRPDSELVAVRMPRPSSRVSASFLDAWEESWRNVELSPVVGQRGVLAHGRHKGHPYVVQEWVPGVDLLTLQRCAALIGRSIPRRFSLSAVAAATSAHLAAQAAGREAGEAWSVSGRLGPHRILIAPLGHLLIATAFAEEGDAARWPVPSDPGEYAFRPPELLFGEESLARSDAWAIGMWIRSIQSGVIPTEAGEITDTVEQIMAFGDAGGADDDESALGRLADALLDRDPAVRMPLGQRVLAVLHEQIRLEGGVPQAREWSRLVAAINPPARTRPPPVELNGDEVQQLLAMLRGAEVLVRPAPSTVSSRGAARLARMEARPATGSTRAPVFSWRMAAVASTAAVLFTATAAVAVAGPDAANPSVVLRPYDSPLLVEPTVQDGALLLRATWAPANVDLRVGPLEAPGEPTRIRVTATAPFAQIKGHTWYYQEAAFTRVDITPTADGFTLDVSCRESCPQPSLFSTGPSGMVLVVSTRGDTGAGGETASLR